MRTVATTAAMTTSLGFGRFRPQAKALQKPLRLTLRARACLGRSGSGGRSRHSLRHRHRIDGTRARGPVALRNLLSDPTALAAKLAQAPAPQQVQAQANGCNIKEPPARTEAESHNWTPSSPALLNCAVHWLQWRVRTAAEAGPYLQPKAKLPCKR